MIVKKISISNFRNFKRKIFTFSSKTTVIVGPNASGKTNVLECLHLLSTGKSFRARVETEMIRYGEEIARVKGDFQNPKTSLETVLTRGEITIGENPERTEKVPRKKLLLNGISKMLYNFAANFRTVLFGPKDLDLVTESPSIRRSFLDGVLSQVDREYRRALLSYEKGLRQRNKLLWQIREELTSNAGGSRLLFWDKLLIKNGDYIGQKRAEFIDFANNTATLDSQNFSLDYDKSAISEARLEQYAQEEIAAATTLVGPHRDDFIMRVKEQESKRARELARFGSRGEQRMSVLWLKLAELEFIKEKTEEIPTLLLDDIFSELDHEHRKVVMKTVDDQQTVISTADPHFIQGLKKVEKIELK